MLRNRPGDLCWQPEARRRLGVARTERALRARVGGSRYLQEPEDVVHAPARVGRLRSPRVPTGTAVTPLLHRVVIQHISREAGQEEAGGDQHAEQLEHPCNQRGIGARVRQPRQRRWHLTAPHPAAYSPPSSECSSCGLCGVGLLLSAAQLLPRSTWWSAQ